MAFKIYKKEDIQKKIRKNIPPRIRISKTTISFTQSLCDQVGLRENSKIVFIQDKANPKDWYIAQHEEGIELRNKNKSSGFIINAASLVEEMRKSIEFVGSKAFLVDTQNDKLSDGIRMFPIFTLKPLD
jgi:hypothetical protein